MLRLTGKELCMLIFMLYFEMGTYTIYFSELCFDCAFLTLKDIIKNIPMEAI